MFLTCFHGRPNISRIWLDHMASLGVLHRIAAVVTIGDRDNIELLDRYGVTFTEAPNQPLGKKHNTALVLAGAQPRYMVLPSDDLISAEWLEVFNSTQGDYLTPDRCGVYCTRSHRSKVLVNRPNGRRNFGAGRIFSRAVVDALGGKVWTDERPNGLDTDSHARITAAGFACEVVTTSAIPITDLKSDGNIWGFDVFKGDPATPAEVLHMVNGASVQWLPPFGLP